MRPDWLRDLDRRLPMHATKAWPQRQPWTPPEFETTWRDITLFLVVIGLALFGLFSAVYLLVVWFRG